MAGEPVPLLGQYEDALVDHNRPLELDPDEPKTIAERSLTYQAMGDRQNAVADFTRAIDLDPTSRAELGPHLDPGSPDSAAAPDPR